LTEKLLRLIETLASPRLLVVGELILDRYIWGEVERVSPEAPIPVLRVSSREERLGGAGCVINNLVTLGARVACCSVLGSDRSGETIAGMLEKSGVDTEGLQIEPGRETPTKTRMIGFVQSANRAAQHIMRMDEEAVHPLGKEIETRLLAYLRERSSDFDAVLISDYGKGLVSAELVSAVVQAAAQRGVPVVVDPRRSEDLSLYRGVTAITPNRYEAAMASGIGCDSFEGLEKAGRKLLEELEVKEVAITIDKEGIFLCRSGGECAHFGVRARSVYDVTGAGDMVLAAFGLALSAGAPVEDAVALANIAAGVEVTKLGAASVSKHELFEAVSSDHMSPESKLRKRSEIRAIAGAHRSAGEVVVFTNGCFDILHPGHVSYLQFARSQGDVLIVGLNSDKSVRDIKGEGRPVVDEGGRAALLGALESVTHIVLFDEPTPKEIVEEVRPDVLVKGEDWAEKGVVGREFVESYGGRVVLAAILEGYSTSAIINRIRKLEGQD
jgi:D-beta-D-heptose 7-phosphate kinase/D-beta-D-heptose 1-phosphate adenosyltransferase